MNKQLLGLVASLGVGVMGVPGTGRAQTIFLPPQPTQPNPVNRPLGNPYYNPYYNLFRPGAAALGPAKPGAETTPALIGVQPGMQPGVLPQVGQTLPLYQDQAVVGLPVTGHPSRFFNPSHYYYYPLVGGVGLGYGTTAPALVSNGLLTSAPRPVAQPGAGGQNTAGQPPKGTAK
jgi:hypothetical protein